MIENADILAWILHMAYPVPETFRWRVEQMAFLADANGLDGYERERRLLERRLAAHWDLVEKGYVCAESWPEAMTEQWRVA